MVSREQYQGMLKKALKRDAEMARSEKEVGFVPPNECDLHAHLRTIESALECAIMMADWDTACEAMVLLQQAIVRIAPPAKRMQA